MQRFLLRTSQNSQLPQQLSETQQAATNPNKVATKQPLSPSQQQSKSPSQSSLDSSSLTHTGSASRSADVPNLRSPESLGPLSYGSPNLGASMSAPEEESSTSVKSEQTSNGSSIPTEPAADSTTAAPTTTTGPGNSFLSYSSSRTGTILVQLSHILIIDWFFNRKYEDTITTAFKVNVIITDLVLWTK